MNDACKFCGEPIRNKEFDHCAACRGTDRYMKGDRRG